MSTQIKSQIQSATSERSSGADTVVGFAVLGCLIAGGVGIAKATGMQSGLDVLLACSVQSLHSAWCSTFISGAVKVLLDVNVIFTPV